jgi:hypothetical protein
VLYDFPDAPRPDADTPAPVRFLPLYDNVYLGYDNRRRMLAESDAKRVNMFSEFKPAVLVDGVISAGWSVESKRGAARLVIEPYHKLRKRDLGELEAEGLAFLKFTQPDAKSYDVEVRAVAD